jgi:hypothetical protein
MSIDDLITVPIEADLETWLRRQRNPLRAVINAHQLSSTLTEQIILGSISEYVVTDGPLHLGVKGRPERRLHCVNQAICVIEAALQERSKRLNDYIINNDKDEIQFPFDDIELQFEFSGMQNYSEYTDWVRSLVRSERLKLHSWLIDCVKHITSGIRL